MKDYQIKHVLKDGSVVDSIAGHLIKASEHPVLYEVIGRMAGETHEAVSTSD